MSERGGTRPGVWGLPRLYHHHVRCTLAAWQAEGAGGQQLPCPTCHLPRAAAGTNEWGSSIAYGQGGTSDALALLGVGHMQHGALAVQQGSVSSEQTPTQPPNHHTRGCHAPRAGTNRPVKPHTWTLCLTVGPLPDTGCMSHTHTNS